MLTWHMYTYIILIYHVWHAPCAVHWKLYFVSFIMCLKCAGFLWFKCSYGIVLSSGTISDNWHFSTLLTDRGVGREMWSIHGSVTLFKCVTQPSGPAPIATRKKKEILMYSSIHVHCMHCVRMPSIDLFIYLLKSHHGYIIQFIQN